MSSIILPVFCFSSTPIPPYNEHHNAKPDKDGIGDPNPEEEIRKGDYPIRSSRLLVYKRIWLSRVDPRT
jgi:hypothetical protein